MRSGGLLCPSSNCHSGSFPDFRPSVQRANQDRRRLPSRVRTRYLNPRTPLCPDRRGTAAAAGTLEERRHCPKWKPGDRLARHAADASRCPHSAMSDIFREIDEELRRDNVAKLWERYGKYIVGLAAVIVLATGAAVGWREYQMRVQRAESVRYA